MAKFYCCPVGCGPMGEEKDFMRCYICGCKILKCFAMEVSIKISASEKRSEKAFDYACPT